MTLLHEASKNCGYDLKLEEVAKIWRGGCIIRSTILEDIRSAYSANADLTSILLSDNISQVVNRAQDGIRNTLKTAVVVGIPMPALMACLAYFDSYRRAWMPSNLIQAQRDFFGAHTYMRNDREGVFHTEWEAKK